MTDPETKVPEGENAEGGQQAPEYAIVPPKREEPGGENAEEKQPAPEYEIVPSKRQEPETNFAADHYRPIVVDAGAPGQNVPGKPPLPQARLSDASIERIGKFASSQTRVYAATGVGLGLLVGLIAAAVFLHPSVPGGPNDMGPVNSSEYGLKGHLVTNWKEKLEYKLTIEPGAPAQRAAFATDVNSSPRPLSIDIQVKDPFGAALCGNTILLKFDPRNAPADAADPGSKAGKAQRALAARNEIAQGIRLALLESQELTREHGRDIFQTDAGPGGQIASISSQGTLPCTKKQFENIASWGFTANFPIVAAPAESQNASPDSNAQPSTGDESSEKSAAAAKTTNANKAKRKAATPASRIYIEGDDEIVWIDASNGIIETRGGKTLLLDKTDAIANTLKGLEFPIPIHYRCEQTGACTFAGAGTGVHHARLR